MARFGLRDSLAQQPAEVRGLINGARWLTVLSRAFYPVVFLLPILSLTGGTAVAAVQTGYTIADILATWLRRTCTPSPSASRS